MFMKYSAEIWGNVLFICFCAGIYMFLCCVHIIICFCAGIHNICFCAGICRAIDEFLGNLGNLGLCELVRCPSDQGVVGKWEEERDS